MGLLRDLRDRERIRIYGANIVEAEHRSHRELQFEHDNCTEKGFETELSPVVIPPDDILPDASAADILPGDVATPTVPVPTPTPSVILICQIPGCRRRPESDPCGLQQVSQDLCCDIFLFSDGRDHTAVCDS